MAAAFLVEAARQIRVDGRGATWSTVPSTPAAAEGRSSSGDGGAIRTEVNLPPRFEEIVPERRQSPLRRPRKRLLVGVVSGLGRPAITSCIYPQAARIPRAQARIEMLALRWKPDVVLVEDKASWGTSLLQELRVGTRLPFKRINGRYR